jgi:hypothetical protein
MPFCNNLLSWAHYVLYNFYSGFLVVVSLRGLLISVSSTLKPIFLEMIEVPWILWLVAMDKKRDILFKILIWDEVLMKIMKGKKRTLDFYTTWLFLVAGGL